MNNDWREYTGDQEYLAHFGVQGMKWGVRRYETASGKLTPAGKARYYGDSDSFKASNGVKVGAPKNKGVEAFRKFQGSKVGSATLNGMAKMNTALASKNNKAFYKKMEDKIRKENEAVRESNKAHKDAMNEGKKGLTDKQKKALKIGAAVVGTAVVAYGGYKLYQLNQKAKSGLQEQYHNAAVKAFGSANKATVKGLASPTIGGGKEFFERADAYKSAGERLQATAKAGKFSIKEKADYLKSQKALADRAKQIVSTPKKMDPKAASDFAKALGAKTESVKTFNQVFGGSKGPSYNTMTGAKTFIDASKRNDDLVQELLRKNTLRF